MAASTWPHCGDTGNEAQPMRRPALHIARTIALVVLLAALLVPAAALAAGDMPDEMVDPAGAMEPEINVGEPAGADETPAAEPAANPVPEVQAAAEPTPSATPSATRAPAGGAVSSGSGSLPFTGPQPGLLTLLFLVGMVALLGGITAFGYARAAVETR
jgi:hypothetical protein